MNYRQVTRELAVLLVIGTTVTTGLLAGAQTKPSHTKTTAKVKSSKAATVVKYKAQCGMVYSAAEAKKYHYICPMDHKALKKIVVSSKGK